MTYDEIEPYFNKIVRLDLKNKKRKIGWLFFDHYHEVSSNPLMEVHYVGVQKRKKLGHSHVRVDMKSVVRYSQIIQIEDIDKVHSPK